VTGDPAHRPTRRLVLWLALAVSCAVAAGLDVFIAISMSELWPVAAAVCALLAAAACVWVAADELRRRRVQLGGPDADPAS
jgi:membrane protein YdbS with pleckstrin-like domain